MGYYGITWDYMGVKGNLWNFAGKTADMGGAEKAEAYIYGAHRERRRSPAKGGRRFQRSLLTK